MIYGYCFGFLTVNPIETLFSAKECSFFHYKLWFVWMGEKADMPMFLFPGSVGITGGVTDGITDGFTIKTKEREISQENGKLLQARFS